MSAIPKPVRTMAELSAKYSAGVRQSTRYTINAVVKIVSVRNGMKQMIFGRIDNMSEGGLAICSPMELQIDETILMEFELPMTKSAMKLSGIIRSSSKGSYGVEFSDLYPRQRLELLRAFKILTPIAENY